MRSHPSEIEPPGEPSVDQQDLSGFIDSLLKKKRHLSILKPLNSSAQIEHDFQKLYKAIDNIQNHVKTAHLREELKDILSQKFPDDISNVSDLQI